MQQVTITSATTAQLKNPYCKMLPVHDTSEVVINPLWEAFNTANPPLQIYNPYAVELVIGSVVSAQLVWQCKNSAGRWYTVFAEPSVEDTIYYTYRQAWQIPAKEEKPKQHDDYMSPEETKYWEDMAGTPPIAVDESKEGDIPITEAEQYSECVDYPTYEAIGAYELAKDSFIYGFKSAVYKVAGMLDGLIQNQSREIETSPNYEYLEKRINILRDILHFLTNNQP